VVIAINKDGDVFWNREYLRDSKALFEKLKVVAVKVPQPEVHIRADQDTRYESVGRVVATCQRAAIMKIGFITEPPARVVAGG
jgi:biopolymer transport protein ExbD